MGCAALVENPLSIQEWKNSVKTVVKVFLLLAFIRGWLTNKETAKSASMHLQA